MQTTKELAINLAEWAQEKKAKYPVILEIGKQSTIADFFVVLSGSSTVQVKAIADHLGKKLNELQINRHTEGYQDGHWILVDCGDVVVHIFTEEMRQFYSLERLWSDVPTVQI
ncbi:MAG: ribosome silencing factor [Bacillota bacterium]